MKGRRGLLDVLSAGKGLFGGAVVLHALAVFPLAAATVTLTPSADTTLLENFPTNNMGGQGWFNAGTTQNYKRNRGLLKFDVAGAIPTGTRIMAATLTLEVTRSPVDGDLPSTFDLHRMLVPWGEGDKQGDPPLLGAEADNGEATWTHRFANTPDTWTEPGGAAGIDYVAASSAETYVYGVNFSPYTFDSSSNIVADVQHWLANPDRNYGWMLKSRSEAENFSARRFASREESFQAPRLTVGFLDAHWERIVSSADGVILEFTVGCNESCVLESSVSLTDPQWLVLINVPAWPTARTIQLKDVSKTPTRFYRLIP